MLASPHGGGMAGVVRWLARTRQAIHPFTWSLDSLHLTRSNLYLSLSPPSPPHLILILFFNNSSYFVSLFHAVGLISRNFYLNSIKFYWNKFLFERTNICLTCNRKHNMFKRVQKKLCVEKNCLNQTQCIKTKFVVWINFFLSGDSTTFLHVSAVRIEITGESGI